MKAGLVRIASRSLLALAVVGLSACNDDPLNFNVKTATRISTNPSVMVLNSGGVQRLTVNTLNDGFEPTFDVPSLSEGAGCTAPVTGDVAVKELPAATAGGSAIGEPIDSVLATGAEPPNKYDITGVGLGETCLVGSFGSLSEEIPVTVVPAVIAVAGPAVIAGGDFSPQTFTADGLDTDSAVNATWDITAPYVTVELQDAGGLPLDTLIASITSISAPNVVEVTRGVAAGTGVLVVSTDQNGVTRSGSSTFSVGIGSITVMPASSGPGVVLTIDGQNLSLGGLPTEVTVDGNLLGNILTESATQVTAEAPSGPAGTYTVQVIAGGVPVAQGTWTQTSDFGPIMCSPGCEVSGGALPITIPYGFTGTIATVDNFYLFNVSRDLTMTMNLGWGTGQDVDLLVVDAGFTAFQCTDGATGADPEVSHCSVTTGGWLLWNNLYAGAAPVTYSNDGTIDNFD